MWLLPVLIDSMDYYTGFSFASQEKISKISGFLTGGGTNARRLPQ